MAEAISIPSPSVFLRPSPPPSTPPPSSSSNTAPPLPAKSDTNSAPQASRNPSNGPAKKKAPKKNAVATETAVASAAPGGDGSAGKPKQSKSRNGCVTCKAKRLKCGEEKPGCRQCSRRNVECGGYKKDFKWRPFEETNVKINIDRQNQAISPPRPRAVSISKPTSPIRTNSTSTSPQTGDPSLSRKDSKRPNAEEESHTAATLPTRPIKAKRKSRQLSPEPRVTMPPDSLHPPPPETRLDPTSQPASETVSPDDLLNQPHPPINRSLNLSPTLTEILGPFSNEDDQNELDFPDLGLGDDMQYPTAITPLLQTSLLDNALLDDDQVDEIARLDDLPYLPLGPIAPRRHAPSLSRSSTASLENAMQLWHGPVNYLYNQPIFPDDSPEMLTFRFDKLTCGILSVMDGQTENPWRNLVWPLAQQSPALYSAIMAMTAFHSSTDVPSLRLVGHEQKQRSIRYIQEGIRDNSMTDQTAIATALALGFSESWDQHTASGNTHIKGAQALVKRALSEHQRNPLHGVELARLKFLCNAWVYMDVIARLTSVDSDESNDFDNTFLFSPDSPQMIMGDIGNSGFGIDFGMPIDARLDPLMGCANTLFPLIGRVANLVRKVCRSQRNSPGIISQANDLKVALEAWDPPAYIERPEDPTTDVQHTLQTAETYRLATLLHLHSSVPELPSLSSAELAQRTLQYLATVPLVSRTVIVQIYPLMVAGCDAVTEEDRQWVRDRWVAMGRRMRIGVIDKCATVTEEVWRRREVYEAQPTTRRKLVATADVDRSRQRGGPSVRTPTTMADSDPGRTGMVFTYIETSEDAAKSAQSERMPNRRSGADRPVGAMDPAYTVRGHLHWVGVMWDWGWEVLLG